MSHFASIVMVVRAAPPELEVYVRALQVALAERFDHQEIILVANHPGTDDARELRALVDRVPDVQLYRLGNKVDDHVAVTAGLDQSIGEVAAIVEPLTDPPEVVARAAWDVVDGADVVYGVDQARRENRAGSLYRLTSKVFAWAFNRTSGFELPVTGTGVRAVSRRVLTEWLTDLDRHRLLRVMPALSSYRYQVLTYEGRRARNARGPSLLTSIRRGISTILRSSAIPIRLAYGLCLVAAVVNFLYAIWVFVLAVGGAVEQGWPSVSLQLSAMFVFLSIVLAIVAEYVYQLVVHAQDRPLYRIAEERTSPTVGTPEHPGVEELEPGPRA